jgi:hypothetical protein
MSWCYKSVDAIPGKVRMWMWFCTECSIGGLFSCEDDVVKAAFVNQQQKFRAFLEELSKTKLEVDPGSEASVKKYYDTMAKIRGRSALCVYRISFCYNYEWYVE